MERIRIMFFFLSKLLLWLLQPLSLVILGLTAALVAFRRGAPRMAMRLVAACLGLIVITGILPLSTALILPLEERFARPTIAPGEQITGVIVLGGAEDARISQARGQATLGDSGERMTAAMNLAYLYPQARIIFSGGATEIVAKSSFGADAAAMFFREQGLDLRRLTLEGRARNTHENAVFTKALIAPKPGERWLLVTSAFHMPRSMGCFRAAGWDVLPWPVDYRTEGRSELWQPHLNPADGIRMLEFAVKEWVGLVAYRVTGRTRDLFPAP
jgi:uncharacterized SAM-binding protein YcdF (DUF218 family)